MSGLPIRRMRGSAALTCRRRAGSGVWALAALLLAAQLLVPAVHAGAQPAGSDAPAGAENLRCIAEAGRVAFLWDPVEPSVGRVSYDYELRLPDGRTEGGNLHGMVLVYRPGQYRLGGETTFSITVRHGIDAHTDVFSERQTLTCYIGGVKPPPESEQQESEQQEPEPEQPEPVPVPVPVTVPAQPVPEQQQSLSSDASLSGLAVYRATDKQPDADNVVPYAGSAYVLRPALTAGVFDYRVRIPDGASVPDPFYVTAVATAASDAKSITVTGRRSNEKARAPKSDIGSGEASGPWQTFPGYGLIEIEVTAQDGVTEQTYRVILERGTVDDPRKVALAAGDQSLTLTWEPFTGANAPTGYVARWRKTGTQTWLNSAWFSAFKTGYGPDAPNATAAEGQSVQWPGQSAPRGAYTISGLDNGASYEAELRGIRGGHTAYSVINWLESNWTKVSAAPAEPAQELTITPTGTTRVYGEADGLGFTVGGLAAGDAAGDVVSGALGRAAGDDAGSYAINMGTLAVASAYAAKYVLPAAPAATAYTITPRPITAISGVTVNSRTADGTADATFDTSAAEGTGVLAAQLADFRAGGLRVSGAFPSAEAGTHDVAVAYSLGDHNSFTAANYRLARTTATLQGELIAEETAPACEPADLAPVAEVTFGADTDLDAVNVNDLSVQSLTLPPCATITPAFRPGHYDYTVTVPNHISRLVVRGSFIRPWKPHAHGRLGFILVGDLADWDKDGPDRLSRPYMLMANSVRVFNTRNVGLAPGVAETVEIGVYKWRSERVYGAFPLSKNTFNKTYTLTVTREEQDAGEVAATEDADDGGAAASVPFAVSAFGDYKDLMTIDELGLPPGVETSPEFRPDRYDYTVTVPHHIGQLDFNGNFIAESMRQPGGALIVVGDLGMFEQNPDANAHMLVADRATGHAGTASVVLPAPGTAKTVEVGLYSHFPSAASWEHRPLPKTKVYTLTMTREAAPGADNAALYDLSGSAGYLDFRRDTTAYKLYVKSDTESLVLTPSALHPQAAATVNGNDPATPVTLAYGQNRIEVKVTAADGVATRTYEVTVIRSSPTAKPGDFSALIAQMYEWRNNPQSSPSRTWTMHASWGRTWGTYWAHTDRWDRALLAFGLTVPDTSLTPMTAAEAQALATSGSIWWRTMQPGYWSRQRGTATLRDAWSRWAKTAAALNELESVRSGKTPNQPPTVTAVPPDTTTDPAPSPFSPLVAGYDTNSDGNLDKYEYRQALRDFSARKITMAQIQEVRAAYYASRR